MKAKKIHVMNASGLHLRPAGFLCQKTMKYKSSIMILFKNIKKGDDVSFFYSLFRFMIFTLSDFFN